MKIVLAPDSFKGTFTSVEVIDMLAVTINKVMGEHEIVRVPVADGGEGTVESLVIATNGRYEEATIHGSLGDKCVKYGVIWGDTAVIEMAAVAGITQVVNANPLHLSSKGLGELIGAVIDAGYKKIAIGIGGSATNDGGIGMLSALGVKFFHKGELLECNAQDLEKIDDIDFSGIKKELKDVDITVICDVKNALLGKNGATYVYGPQKGVDTEMMVRLEKGMKNYADVVKRVCGKDLNNIEGGGAAGGVGAALAGIVEANIKNGIETILEIIKFDDIIKDADLVITGEGRMDSQSVKYGKVPVGIAAHCEKLCVPVSIIAGVLAEGWQDILKMKYVSVMSTVDSVFTNEQLMEGAEERFFLAAERMLRFINMMK